MEKLTFTHSQTPPYIFVDWNMSSICNYDCYYCNEVFHDGKVKFPDIQVAKNVVDKIELEYKEKDFAYFNLLGGEPTAWKHLEEFSYYVKKVNDKNILQLVTNGSRSLQWWVKHAKFIDRIIVSVHVAQCDIKELVSKFNTIVNETDIRFVITMDVKLFDKCVEYYNYAYDNLSDKIKLLPKPLRVQLGGPLKNQLMPYTKEQKITIQNLKEKWAYHKSRQYSSHIRQYSSQMMQDGTPIDIVKLITNEENNWKGWACWIGIETISITRNGDVKIGIACNPHLKLGTIKNLNFKIPMKPVKCMYDKCSCWADIQTTKIKNYTGETL
jgi:MoaA/NifB/PqqE/SkfB family radical SAM enzyme